MIRTRDGRLSRVSHLLLFAARIAANYARLRFLKNSLLAAKVIIDDMVAATATLR